MSTSKLFSPLQIGSVTLPNRIVASPMCQYSAQDGEIMDWHQVHYGKLAYGGAGLVMLEASAVEARGRISHGDLGIWAQRHIAPLARVAELIRGAGSVPGIQLAHAGRKGSAQRPWDGGAAVTKANVPTDEMPWTCIAPSPIAVADNWPIPDQMTTREIAEVTIAWQQAAIRALQAGFDVIEIHGAHGYLLHQFLSPIINKREDDYGGSRENRMRFALEVTKAVREVWPAGKPLFFRVSAVDGDEGGWALDDTIALAAALQDCGVDVIDCSSGGATGSPVLESLKRRPGFQVPFATRVKQETGIMAMAVGLIIDPEQAEAHLQAGQADLIALARELLNDAQWPLHAARILEGEAGYALWPKQYAWSLSRREDWMHRYRAGEFSAS